MAFVCINPQEGRKEFGSSHMGSVGRPAMDVMPIIPIPLPSAGTVTWHPLSKTGDPIDRVGNSYPCPLTDTLTSTLKH